MMTSRILLAVVLLGVPGFLFAAEPDPELIAAEKKLKEAKIAVDGPDLVAFVQKRILNDDSRAKIAATIKRLGDNDFGVREQAQRDLVAMGSAALPMLRLALSDADAEIAYRAERCIAAINLPNDLELLSAAARVLAVRRPKGTVEAILAYLPQNDDPYLQEVFFKALAEAGVTDGELHPKLKEAMTDKTTVRRQAAAAVLAKAGEKHRPALVKMLEDAEAAVRFQAASALAQTGEKAAVPALIRLLSDGEGGVGWMVEDLLLRIAGEKSPAASLGAGDKTARQKCREAWEQWWKANEKSVDLAKVQWEDPYLGLTLVVEHDSTGKDSQGRIYEFGPDGKIRWMIDNGCGGPIDVRPLPGGRILVSEYMARRVTERDRTGKILWEYPTNNSAVGVQRLANGNTFITTLSDILEVTPEKKVVSHPVQNKGSIYTSLRLKNGNILYAHSSGHIIEIDAAGKQLRSTQVGDMSGWGGIDLLSNGNYLVAMYTGGKVAEVDPASGKKVWEFNVQSPSLATRLRNGNILLSSADSKTLYEFTREGKEVWKRQAEGRPFRVRRY